jgi:hypothetical protein
MNQLFRASLIGAALAGAMSGAPAFAALSTTAINGSTVTAETMAQSLLGSGSGITINSATYTGVNPASGLFSGGTGIIGFASGIVLTSGDASFVTGPNNNDGFTVNTSASGDSDLNALISGNTNDASVLEINFTPAGDKITFSYVFGSEEYNEYVNSSYNDVFAFFVNGVNAAVIPGTTNTQVSINNLNCGNPFSGVGPNCDLFINNDLNDGGPTIDTQLDGLTKVLFIAANVNAGVANTLKIAIADTSDSSLDSAVFIQGGTLTVCGGPGQPPCTGGGGGGGEVSEPAGLALLGLVGIAAGWTRRRTRKA